MSQDAERLVRGRIDVVALSAGNLAARSTASIVLWGIVAFLGFFLFLALNMAAGFYLGAVMGGSMAWGFLYLAMIYAGLIVLVLLLRHWIQRSVRDAVSKKAIAETQRLNQYIDRLPYVRRQLYASPSRSIDHPGNYLMLQQLRYQTLLMEDETLPRLLEQVTYFREHRDEVIGDVIKETAMPYLNEIPVLGSLLSYFGGGSQRSASQRGRQGSKQASEKKGWARYSPYVMMAWSFLRPTLTSIAISKVQDLIFGLFGASKSKGRSRHR